MYFFFNFSKKISLEVSCESSAKQMIHMKYQDLFSDTLKVKQPTVYILNIGTS